jgi:uncharacterized membrane protein (UPF0127 family)
MPKIGYLIIFILILIIAFLVYFRFPRKITKSITQKISGQDFSLDIADNSYLQAKGLSGISKLAANDGMLFIFNGEAYRYFWMKDTLIPLDMIFITQSGQVTDIDTAVPEPGKSDLQLKIYQSSQPVKYVIELNANTAQKINLKIGDFININNQ